MNLKNATKGDVLVLTPSSVVADVVEAKLPKLQNGSVKVAGQVELSYAENPWIYENAWKNTFRNHMRNHRFLTSASSYIPLEQIANSNPLKESIRVAAEIIDGQPHLWMNPGTKVMIPLTFDETKYASEDQPLSVRVLMDWHSAFLVGVYNETIGGYSGYDLFSLWRSRGVPVRKEERVYKVKFSDESQPYPYPQSCVFKEFEQGRKDSSFPKHTPSQKIEITSAFLKNKIGTIRFLGTDFSFDANPTEASALTNSVSQFESGNDFIVTLKKDGRHFPVKVFGIRDALLNGAEPYTGKKLGKYRVICPSILKDHIGSALDQIRLTYQKLNMGSICLAGQVRFVEARSQSEYREAFNLTINEIIEEAREINEPTIVFVVLPVTTWENSLYYSAKDTFFNPSAVLEEVKPIQIQCLESNTVRILPRNEPVSSNIAPQVYLKLYGRHAAIWLCNKPADSHVYPNDAGITAYACFDVSRRRKLKSQVSVFTAVTDGYGRFIAYDTFSAGGENLTPLAFAKLIENIARICKQYSDSFARREPNLKFQLKRIVLYKDGQIDRVEAGIMKNVFENGIPEEGIDPISSYFSGRQDLPQSLAIDILGVNKSSIKRAFVRSGSFWNNPERGLCMVERNGNTALLFSSQAQRRSGTEINTIKPLEIEQVHHFSINSNLATPNVDELAREYYHLTFLDWVSFYQKSKFALPQRITQKTGEYLSYQVHVPTGITLI